jgi:hypothetical protein
MTTSHFRDNPDTGGTISPEMAIALTDPTGEKAGARLAERLKERNIPLLTMAEVEAWRNEVEQLTGEITTKSLRVNWLRQRLAAARIFVDTAKENP